MVTSDLYFWMFFLLFSRVCETIMEINAQRAKLKRKREVVLFLTDTPENVAPTLKKFKRKTLKL